MLRLTKKKTIDIEAFIADCCKGLQLVIEEHRKKWHLGQEKSWAVDEAQGKISFFFSDGVVATAEAQVVGTYQVSKKIFTWGWKHPNVVLNLQRDANLVKEFGTKYKSKELTTRQVPCTEKRAWEYTALAAMLAEANGAYCLQRTDDIFVYLTFGAVDLKKVAT